MLRGKVPGKKPFCGWVWQVVSGGGGAYEIYNTIISWPYIYFDYRNEETSAQLQDILEETQPQIFQDCASLEGSEVSYIGDKLEKIVVLTLFIPMAGFPAFLVFPSFPTFS